MLFFMMRKGRNTPSNGYTYNFYFQYSLQYKHSYFSDRDSAINHKNTIKYNKNSVALWKICTLTCISVKKKSALFVFKFYLLCFYI